MEKEGTLVREDDPKSSCYHSLYFKGLVKKETTSSLVAGFGVAICRQEDNYPLFQMKGSIHNSKTTLFEAELTALKRALKEAVSLGITHILIYCDLLQIYQLVMGNSAQEEGSNIALLMNDVQKIRQQFTSSIPLLVPQDQIKFAYKLATETVASEINITIPPDDKKSTCRICYDDDFEAEQMFSIGLCGHQYCIECLKQYIQAKLFEGKNVLSCPHYKCKTKLTLTSCTNLLTPKLREMWERRNEEESIPVEDRVYCPNPRCSVLICKLDKDTVEGSKKCCFKCSEPFCINCKVPWHSNLSCHEYKRLGPNPSENDMKLKVLANKKLWRQCGKCQHMIELYVGCSKLTCRCGYTFCYTCGEEWKLVGCYHGDRFLVYYAIVSLLFFIMLVTISCSSHSH